MKIPKGFHSTDHVVVLKISPFEHLSFKHLLDMSDIARSHHAAANSTWSF